MNIFTNKYHMKNIMRYVLILPYVSVNISSFVIY